MNEILFKNTDEKVIRLIKLIKESIKGTSFENHIFLTGGIVRDIILGRDIKDIDIVVDTLCGSKLFATYMTMRTLCFQIGKNPAQFQNYGTYKFQIFNNEELKDFVIECVDTRKAKYINGVTTPYEVFGTLEEDANRRDLTINSLYYNISTDKLFDFTSQSISDMLSKTLRTPFNAEKILEEDPIKILRIIRFATELGWGIEKNTWLAMIKNAHLLEDVAKEKISSEISKILICEKPSIGIRKMYNCGVLEYVIPDICDSMYAYESKNPKVMTFGHTMDVLDSVQPYIENRLAALYHDVGRIITEQRRDISPDTFSGEVAAVDLKVMKFPKSIINSVETAIKYHRFFSKYEDGTIPPLKKIRKFMNLVGDDIGTTIDLMNANNQHCTFGKKKRQVLDILDKIEEIEKENEEKQLRLPIDGNDIIKEFRLKPSPLIGTLLEGVKEAYFENPQMTKDEAFEVVEKTLKLVT